MLFHKDNIIIKYVKYFAKQNAPTLSSKPKNHEKVQYQSFNYKRKIKPPVFLMELHHLSLSYHNSSISNSYTLPEIFIWNTYPKILKKKVLMSL